MAKKLALLGLGALLGPLLAVSPLTAQEAAPKCGGLDATIVVNPQTEQPVNESGTWLLEGTEGDDVIHITFDPDWTTSFNIISGAGNDTICTFASESSGLWVDAGEGNDTIFIGGSSLEHWRFNQAFGGPGDDVLHGGPFGDLLIGGEGNDELFSYQGEDMLEGHAGNDVLSGGKGLDFLFGGNGDDTAYGGPGLDFVYGGLGRDTLFGGAGSDLLFSKDDFIGFGSKLSEQGFELNTPPGPVGIASTSSYSEDTAGSRMFGGEGADLLIGSNRWDRMQGGPGDDFMLGMEGRDWMRGGPGNDTILGGLGVDDLNGNLGADQLLVDGRDIGRGGFGNDTCVSTNGSVRLASCEALDIPGPEWDDLLVPFERLVSR